MLLEQRYGLYSWNGNVARASVLTALLERQCCLSEGTDCRFGTAMLLERGY
jgi:hypothetical protein